MLRRNFQAEAPPGLQSCAAIYSIEEKNQQKLQNCCRPKLKMESMRGYLMVTLEASFRRKVSESRTHENLFTRRDFILLPERSR